MVPLAGRPPRLRSAPLYVSRPAPSKRVWADDFPAVALEEFVVFVGAARAALRKILKQAAGSGRGVEKQRPGGFAAGVLPGMRDVARHERAGAGPADGDLVADLKGDLAGEHPGDLVAVGGAGTARPVTRSGAGEGTHLPRRR